LRRLCEGADGEEQEARCDSQTNERSSHERLRPGESTRRLGWYLLGVKENKMNQEANVVRTVKTRGGKYVLTLEGIDEWGYVKIRSYTNGQQDGCFMESFEHGHARMDRMIYLAKTIDNINYAY